MELLVSSAIGILTASGIYLMLRSRTFPIILGITFLSYAVNLFLFSMGRLAIDSPPVISPDVMVYADPVPQALVLTAIVISFGMSALIVVLALRGYLETGSDQSRLEVAPEDVEPGSGVRSGSAASSVTGFIMPSSAARATLSEDPTGSSSVSGKKGSAAPHEGGPA